MKKYKKIVIPLAIAIFVCVVIFVFFKKDKTISPAIESLPNPIDLPESAPSSKYDIQISEKDFKFPKNIPLLKVDNQTRESDFDPLGIAKNLGFVTDPQIEEDINEGKVYIWNNATNGFDYYKNSKRFGYFTHNSEKIDTAINKQFKKEDHVDVALNFAINNFPIDKDQFEFYSIIHYCAKRPFTEGLSPCDINEANITKVSFTPSYNNIPLLPLDPKNTFISAQILKDGSIYKFLYQIPPQLTQTDIQYRLKDYKKFVEDIGKSTIVDYDAPIYLRDEKSINKITINTIKLVYLFDSSKSVTYQPIFVLEGKVNFEGIDQDRDVTLYLPAIYDN